jgi:hypothetical protein
LRKKLVYELEVLMGYQRTLDQKDVQTFERRNSNEYEFVKKIGNDYSHVCPQGLVFHPFHGVIDF